MSWLSTIVSWFTRGAVTAAGHRALAEAERLFALDVVDPLAGSKNPNAKRWLEVINWIIQRSGWTWIQYNGNAKGATQWCGMFAAACWRKAGIDPKWLAPYFASTIRLRYWGLGRDWDAKHPNGIKRPHIELGPNAAPSDCAFPDGSFPRAGDVAVVGNGGKPEGNHIVIVVSYDPETGILHTINGNGGGLGPDGERREGIVKTDYPVGDQGAGYHVMFVYRPLASDLLA